MYCTKIFCQLYNLINCFVLTDLDKLDGVLKRKRRHSEVEEESLTLSDYLKRKREEYDGHRKTSKKRVFMSVYDNFPLSCSCCT